jgi:hypothetical protein
LGERNDGTYRDNEPHSGSFSGFDLLACEITIHANAFPRVGQIQNHQHFIKSSGPTDLCRLRFITLIVKIDITFCVGAYFNVLTG